MKKIAVIVLIIIFVVYVAANLKVFGQPSTDDGCPKGTYNIGISKTDEPLCKIIPTGCPYGDSIPMDKCNNIDENAMSHNIEVGK